MIHNDLNNMALSLINSSTMLIMHIKDESIRPFHGINSREFFIHKKKIVDHQCNTRACILNHILPTRRENIFSTSWDVSFLNMMISFSDQLDLSKNSLISKFNNHHTIICLYLNKSYSRKL